MKPVNTVFIFLIIVIIIIAVIFQVRNTRQTSQTQPILVSGNIDETQITQETPESENPPLSSSLKDNLSIKSGIKETPTDSHEEPLVKGSNTSEKIVETLMDSKKHPQDNSRDNTDDPSENPDQDNREKSSRLISLGDNTFMIHPGWVNKERRSERFKQYAVDDQSVCFTVDEPLKGMKWSKFFEEQIDPQLYSQLVFEYTAERLKADEKEYILWLFDLRGSYGGFTAIPSTQIISDGSIHTIHVELNQFDIKEFIHQIAIQVYSGEEGNASLTIHRLEFLPKEDDEK